ncbi:MAG TPA: crosslink repair DNA glycosylase YcaQ family protein [Terriglobales bacterium]|nr:crosslink repair DNA glycosylase YcaQ family protein [Terriglobales bacterium]
MRDTNRMPPTLDDLRHQAVAQTLFAPATLKRALEKLAFVQADPIRAPARAQDLILRHRVKNYQAGDLEHRYAKLGVEEDFFINYGFISRPLQALMHPRSNSRVPAAGCLPFPPAQRKRALLLLDFIRERGPVHPREVDKHFAHGTVENYWGGSSNATTHLLDAMHYQGLLRIVRRERGIRVYAVHEHELTQLDKAAREARIDALVDAAVNIYAPLPGKSLSLLLRRLRFATPQWQKYLTAAIQRAKHRLNHARINEIDWYWPAKKLAPVQHDTVRLLTPFDPIVWDRDRFELLWGWTYRFEAYTPPAKRKLGYYALPLLWRDRVIGWANLSVKNGGLKSEIGYVNEAPHDAAYKGELAAELDRMGMFLKLQTAPGGLA